MRKSGQHIFVSRSPRLAFFALLGLGGLLALWQLGFVLGGPFVVPPPGETFILVIDLIGNGAVWQPAMITARDVLIGYAAGCLAGLVFGLAAGAAADIAAALEPVATIVLGIPPIAWVVLALLWFGPQGMAAAFTVAIGIAPIIFAAAIAGLRGAKPELDELATAYHAPPWQRLVEIHLPQMAVSLVPALATALGLAWKMALMAEVLGGGQGIGGRLADARSHLDMAETMAWIVIALGLLLATDRLLARAAASMPVVSR